MKNQNENTRHRLEELNRSIEVARGELEDTLDGDDYGLTYEKSVYLDKLIEEYIDIKEELEQINL